MASVMVGIHRALRQLLGRNNALQCRRGDLQCVVLAVDVNPHRERWIGVPEPRRHHRYGHTLQVHQRSAAVAGVV